MTHNKVLTSERQKPVSKRQSSCKLTPKFVRVWPVSKTAADAGGCKWLMIIGGADANAQSGSVRPAARHRKASHYLWPNSVDGIRHLLSD
jgi:hypothetical protein